MAKFTHGPGIDDPLIVRYSNNNFFYHKNHQGSVTELANANGNVVKTYRCDAFGNIVQETGPSINFGFTYTSRELHSRSGLYYYRARFYNPELGRFITQDPIGLEGGINLYAYVGNMPVILVDPLGLTWRESLRLFSDWYNGEGAEVRFFGPETNQVKDLMRAPGVNAARNYHKAKNKGKCPPEDTTDYDVGFGILDFMRAGLNPTEHFVGSYKVYIYPQDGYDLFVVLNVTSNTSFIEQEGPSWDRSEQRARGNMFQVYYWTESWIGGATGTW